MVNTPPNWPYEHFNRVHQNDMRPGDLIRVTYDDEYCGAIWLGIDDMGKRYAYVRGAVSTTKDSMGEWFDRIRPVE